jgi:hypothetical protein
VTRDRRQLILFHRLESVNPLRVIRHCDKGISGPLSQFVDLVAPLAETSA